MNLIKVMADKFGLSPDFVQKTISFAPRSYKRFEISKKNGQKRTVYQPARKVKLLQSFVSDEIIKRFPLHPAVFSYREGLSIRDNAEQHRRNNYLLRLDFRNFFESIEIKDVIQFFICNVKNAPFVLSHDDILLLSQLCCFRADDGKLRVVIGAPSSPSIANAILYDFDVEVFDHCKSQGIIYTRYADDLYFSTNHQNLLSKIPEFVSRVLSQTSSPRLMINEKKTYHTSKKHRRIVTGLTITSENRISIGRDRKREIRTLVFKCISNSIDIDKKEYLRGLLSYVSSVDPDFFFSLLRKFGEDAIYSIQKNQPQSDRNVLSTEESDSGEFPF